MKIAKEIRSVEDWLDQASPAGGKKHWVDGRSAKELAKAWFPRRGEPQVPVELHALLRSVPQFSNVVFEEAEPEARVRFDGIPGEPRNCDLLVKGSADGKRFVMSIEAKADETFGKLVSLELEACSGRPSRLPERITRLTSALFGSDASNCGDLRYQLLHGVAAAISAAREAGAELALFVVHEFVTDATDDKKHKQNATDLNAFIQRLSGGAVRTTTAGQLVGPFSVPGNDHCPASVQLFIGKSVRNTRT